MDTTVTLKDYYLILGISSDATPEEIEKAFKDADKRINVHGTISKDFLDVQEAFHILSNPELKILYDEEYEAYRLSINHDIYTIRNSKLAELISSLQRNLADNATETSGCGFKIGKGCLWVIFVIGLILQIVFVTIMKQRARNAVRSQSSYVLPSNINDNIYTFT